MTHAEYANIALRAGAIAARRPIGIEDIGRVPKEFGKHVHIEGEGKSKHFVFDKGDKPAILKLLHDGQARALLSGNIIEVREKQHPVREAA